MLISELFPENFRDENNDKVNNFKTLWLKNIM